jgi:glycosyltransferase involved in cell wall biosynthesis
LRSLFCEKEWPELLPRARAVELRVFTAAQAAVTTTEANRRHIMEQYHLPPEKTHCIPNYVPDSFYTVESAGSHGSHDSHDSPIITQVGRLAPEKNLFALIKACSGLNVRLQFIGEGEERPALMEYASANGVSLHITGSVPHERLPQMLSESAICALVSHFEGHPKALIEYMACGRPVLATDVPGITPLIEHGKTGMLCAPEAESIRQALRSLLADAELRERLGKNARDYAKRFSLQKIVEKELRLYRSLPASSTLRGISHGAARLATAAGRIASRRLKRILGGGKGIRPKAISPDGARIPGHHLTTHCRHK